MNAVLTEPDGELPAFARNAVNLASAGLGARVVSVTDDFFAEAGRMLADGPSVFYPDRYDDHGKWMDGWESRRRRGPGHDSAVVKLAVSGVVRGFDIDTSHFTGNYPPACSIDACSGEPGSDMAWTPILPMTPLGPGAHHFARSVSESAWSHVRLNIFPDGGIARFRVFGEPWLDRIALAGTTMDLASALNGGRVIAMSDAHYGAFRRILAPGRGTDMGDGWETRRRRTPGNDWIIIALGARGFIEAAEIDTAHYKGNYPDAASIQAADLGEAVEALDEAVIASSMFWDELLPASKLSADAIHAFDKVAPVGPVTHIRLNIFPDGGVSRLRLYGRLSD